MGDHFWPAVYPGLIVGLLYGLSQRGISNAILGAVAGAVGAVLSTSLLDSMGLTEGVLAAATLVAASALAAYGAVTLARLARSAPPR
jgi:hypothetical protein